MALTTAVAARTDRRRIARVTLAAVAGASGVLYALPDNPEAARIASGSRPGRR